MKPVEHRPHDGRTRSGERVEFRRAADGQPEGLMYTAPGATPRWALCVTPYEVHEAHVPAGPVTLTALLVLTATWATYWRLLPL